MLYCITVYWNGFQEKHSFLCLSIWLWASFLQKCSSLASSINTVHVPVHSISYVIAFLCQITNTCVCMSVCPPFHTYTCTQSHNTVMCYLAKHICSIADISFLNNSLYYFYALLSKIMTAEQCWMTMSKA